ncbi:MAG: FHA domain-containing protein [bacterium]
MDIQYEKLNVTISGGGPVGLSFALLLVHLLGEKVNIRIYDGRWCYKDSKVVWRSVESGNSRRQQVVTLQSRQYLKYPQEIQDRLFTEGNYSEMWPIGPDSIKGYPPRNIRIAYIEDQLLAIANEKSSYIELIPKRFKIEEQEKNLTNQHILAICEGGNSKTREFFIDQFGQASTSVFSLNNEHLQDVVLGLRVKSELSDPMSVLLTVAQNRFLLNSLKGNGFLNMRLTDEEVREVVGLDMKNTTIELKVCIQSNPCLMECADPTNQSSNFGCSRHGTLFLPALLKEESPLWRRIQEGLKLFAVKPENLTAVTAFRLDMVQRPRFTTQLYPTTKQHVGTFGFLLGDSANAIHFWSGRGLNNGIATAASLARCLTNNWRNRSFRESDFVRHEGLMAMLQYRHKSRGWQTMIETDEEGNQYAIKERIAEGIDLAERSDVDKNENLAIIMQRLVSIRERLKARLQGLPTDEELLKHLGQLDASTLKTLVVSNVWNTQKVGGEEVDIDLFFDEPDWVELQPCQQKLATLTYVSGAERVSLIVPKFEIEETQNKINVGRDHEWSHICISELSVSRHHAFLIKEGHRLTVKDNNSSYGTTVNGYKLLAGQSKELQQGDEMTFGQVTYRLSYQ